MKSLRNMGKSLFFLFFLVAVFALSGCQNVTSSADEAEETAATERSEKKSVVQRVKEVFTGPTFEVPAETKVTVRLSQMVSTDTAQSGDEFTATLSEDLRSDEKLLAPAGSKVLGELTHVEDADKVKGRAQLTMTLTHLIVNGDEYELGTHPLTFRAEGTKKEDAAVIGGSAAAGAVIGAVTGGKKGAAVGAGVGAGAGTGYVLATKGKEVEFAPETKIAFTLSDSLRLPEYRKE